MNTPSKTIASALCAAALLLPGAGCAPKVPTEFNTDFDQNELVDFFEAYTEYSKQNQRPPRQLSDLKKLEEIHPLGLRVVREGKVVPVWGVTGTDPRAVMAYQKTAPTEGGAVLLAGGDVVRMSAAELKAANPKVY